ncbi:MAG TPA: phosphoenolpyruvate carboxylase [Anaerolineae bacterium]|nr:phosphoenolpyruvate carboxylase [Anaerolineae bacterium]
MAGGQPPLGRGTLDRDDIELDRVVYVIFEQDLRDAVRYLNLDMGLVPKELASKVQECPGIVPLDEKHHNELADYICSSLRKNGIEDLSEHVLRAASLRRFLG